MENADIERLKEIFITRKEHESKMDVLEAKILSDSVELAVIKHKLDTISWVSKTTLGAVIAALVGAVVKFMF